MNKILNNIIKFLQSFTGLFIYLVVNTIFSILLKNIVTSNKALYFLILYLSDIILLTILILVFNKRIKKDFKDFDKNYKEYLSFAIKVWFIGIIVMSISNAVIYQFINKPYNQQVNELILTKLPLYSVISMIMCGPFIEEITFRLSFKEHIKNKYAFLIITTLIFAGVHVLNGINNPIELLFFIPYGSISFAFAYILYKTDNIFTTVLIHTFHNSLAVLLLAITTLIGV